MKHRKHRGPPWHDFWNHAPPGRSPHEWRAMFEQFLGEPPEDHWMFGGRRFRPWQMGEWVFNPFVSMALSKGGGLLPLYVLHLLNQKSRYGNELMTLITERTGHGWVTNPGAVYPLLNELEEQGLILGGWDDLTRRTVRHYTITDAGRDELDRLRAVMKPKLKEALEVLHDMLDDLDDMATDIHDSRNDTPGSEKGSDDE
ncbi:MAG: PadR family transcriptional regulator [Anaerolineae bacterium]|nr:PadR family transcriptional regulator [Anaerolineae bacterium]